MEDHKKKTKRNKTKFQTFYQLSLTSCSWPQFCAEKHFGCNKIFCSITITSRTIVITWNIIAPQFNELSKIMISGQYQHPNFYKLTVSHGLNLHSRERDTILISRKRCNISPFLSKIRMMSMRRYRTKKNWSQNIKKKKIRR